MKKMIAIISLLSTSLTASAEPTATIDLGKYIKPGKTVILDIGASVYCPEAYFDLIIPKKYAMTPINENGGHCMYINNDDRQPPSSDSFLTAMEMQIADKNQACKINLHVPDVGYNKLLAAVILKCTPTEASPKKPSPRNVFDSPLLKKQEILGTNLYSILESTVKADLNNSTQKYSWTVDINGTVISSSDEQKIINYKVRSWVWDKNTSDYMGLSWDIEGILLKGEEFSVTRILNRSYWSLESTGHEHQLKRGTNIPSLKTCRALDTGGLKGHFSLMNQNCYLNREFNAEKRSRDCANRAGGLKGHMTNIYYNGCN